MTETKIPTPTTSAFIEALQAGVAAWEVAGRILVALRNEDADVFKRIVKDHPFVTIDTLEVFYHIGTRTLYPMVVLLPRHAMSAVRQMSYEKQVQICNEPVEIVTRMSGGKPVIVRKPITQMSTAECKKALWRRGNLSVDKQVRELTTLPAKIIAELTPKPVRGPIARVPATVSTYSVRRAVGGGFAFEKTMARPMTTQRILLTNGQAVIELTEYKD